METAQRVITLDQDEMVKLLGHGDAKLKQIQSRLQARLVARGNELRLSGNPDDVERAHAFLTELIDVQRGNRQALTTQQVEMAARHHETKQPGSFKDVFLDTIPLPLKRQHLAPLTPNQKRYIDSIRQHDIVFALGPAGTGKTYLAVAMAVWKLLSGTVGRIILVRPAVEAGEKLGFLPGDIAAKFNPFVRPLFDALHEMLEPERLNKFLEDGIIEIAPLAFMRGRTLNNSFIILDEAQNTTSEQMKMFLTRLGLDSQAVITGDPSQVDLPRGQESGLTHVAKVLANTEGIDFIRFERGDVVRHSLVQRIIEAYEAHG